MFGKNKFGCGFFPIDGPRKQAQLNFHQVLHGLDLPILGAQEDINRSRGVVDQKGLVFCHQRLHHRPPIKKGLNYNKATCDGGRGDFLHSLQDLRLVGHYRMPNPKVNKNNRLSS